MHPVALLASSDPLHCFLSTSTSSSPTFALSLNTLQRLSTTTCYNHLTLHPLSATLNLSRLTHTSVTPPPPSTPTLITMSLDMWTHEFCLSCDRQVQIDGEAYCSEACKMADFEKTPSTPSSRASSPGFSPASSYSSRPAPAKFYLSPAYDFNQARPYGSTPQPSSSFGSYSSETSPLSARSLTPSSSHSSLCSMESVSSTAEASQLSDKARMELRAYAVSFEQVRLQRRRSY